MSWFGATAIALQAWTIPAQSATGRSGTESGGGLARTNTAWSATTWSATARSGTEFGSELAYSPNPLLNRPCPLPDPQKSCIKRQWIF